MKYKKLKKENGYLKNSLNCLASRNIRFLNRAQDINEFHKILVHTDHLRKIAIKLKLLHIHKMLSDTVWETITRVGEIEKKRILSEMR